VVLPADGEAPKVVKSCEEALDFPAPARAAQQSSVLGRAAAFIPVWGDHFDASPGKQVQVQHIAVIGLIADRPLRPCVNESLVLRPFHEGHFMRRSTFDPNGDRNTIAVGNVHELAPFAALGWPNPKSPFLAAVNEPSMKVSR